MNNLKQLFNKQFFMQIIQFFNSNIYIIIMFLIALANWYFKIIYLLLPIAAIFFSLIILLDINRNRLIPLILFSMTGIRLQNINDYIIPVIIGSVIVIPILIIDLFRIKTLFYKSNILKSLYGLLGAMILSLITTQYFGLAIQGVLQMIFYVLLILYLYNKQTLNKEEDRLYVAKIFVYWGLLIFFECFLFFLTNADLSNPASFYTSKRTNLGWGITNYIAIVYLVIIPITTYYYIMNQKKYHILLVLLIDIATFILMMSRSGYLAFLILILPFLFRIILDVTDKIKFYKILMAISIIVLIISLFVIIPSGLVKTIFNALDNRGFSLSGREKIYQDGLNAFKEYPLFGTGVYTSEMYISTTNKYYHNYLIQTFATLGLVGAIAFGYYIYTLIKQCLIKNKFNYYVLFVVLAMLIHGLFDTTFYNPLVMIILSVLFAYIKESDDVTLNKLEQE